MDQTKNQYSLPFIQSMLSGEGNRVTGWYKDLSLATLFQPVFSLSHMKEIGADAVLRATDANGRNADSGALFADVTNFSETLLLDRLSMALHLKNFFAPQPTAGVVFVNVQPGAFLAASADDTFLSDLLASCGASNQKVVLEVPDSVLDDRVRAMDAVRHHRDLGFLIAIDHFGSENSDLDAIWPLQPAFVKIDRAIFTRTARNPDVKGMMRRVVSTIHEMGAFAVMEGVENRGEAMTAIASDVDFVSGYYFASPVEARGETIEGEFRLQQLWTAFREEGGLSQINGAAERAPLQEAVVHSAVDNRLRAISSIDLRNYREERRPYLIALQQAMADLEDGADFERACRNFLAIPSAIRCFVLDGEGRQLGLETWSPSPPERQKTDFVVAVDASNADWSRKDFFRRAIHEPGVVQVSRPYRSIIGYGSCVTVSLTAKVQGRLRVICGDIDWSAHTRVLSRQAKAGDSNDVPTAPQ